MRNFSSSSSSSSRLSSNYLSSSSHSSNASSSSSDSHHFEFEQTSYTPNVPIESVQNGNEQHDEDEDMEPLGSSIQNYATSHPTSVDVNLSRSIMGEEENLETSYQNLPSLRRSRRDEEVDDAEDIDLDMDNSDESPRARKRRYDNRNRILSQFTSLDGNENQAPVTTAAVDASDLLNEPISTSLSSFSLSAPRDQRHGEEKCNICLQMYFHSGKIDSCNHVFCFNCIRRWSHEQTTCPLCRAEFTLINKVSLNGFVEETINFEPAHIHQPIFTIEIGQGLTDDESVETGYDGEELDQDLELDVENGMEAIEQEARQLNGEIGGMELFLGLDQNYIYR